MISLRHRYPMMRNLSLVGFELVFFLKLYERMHSIQAVDVFGQKLTVIILRRFAERIIRFRTAVDII